MPVTFFRRLLSLFILTAYMAAGMLQITMMAPDAASAAKDMPGMAMANMAGMPSDTSEKMPCKGSMPGCMTELGCMFMVSLPAQPDLALLTQSAWSAVAYLPLRESLRGRTIKPALGPPISRA